MKKPKRSLRLKVKCKFKIDVKGGQKFIILPISKDFWS